MLIHTPATSLPALWKQSLSPDLLASVLTVLADHVMPQDATHALGMLRALRDVPRIGVVVRLVPAAVVRRVRDAVAACGEAEEARAAALAVLPS